MKYRMVPGHRSTNYPQTFVEASLTAQTTGLALGFVISSKGMHNLGKETDITKRRHKYPSIISQADFMGIAGLL